MWQGEGWQRTRRQLGVFSFLVCLALEAIFHANIPITVYSVIGGLLGLDLLAEALTNLQTATSSTGDRRNG